MYCSPMRYDCPVTAMRRLRIACITTVSDYWVYQSTTVQVKCLYSLTLNHFGEFAEKLYPQLYELTSMFK